MTDLEFYKKAIMYQSFVVNKVAKIVAYNKQWTKKFSIKQLLEGFDEYRNTEEVKSLFNVNNLTKERALNLRFVYLDRETNPNLMLFPLWFALLLPYGTKVIDINGNEMEYTKDTDLDIRFGCVAFGVNIKQ
jgi:hypothetical protein